MVVHPKDPAAGVISPICSGDHTRRALLIVAIIIALRGGQCLLLTGHADKDIDRHPQRGPQGDQDQIDDHRPRRARIGLRRGVSLIDRDRNKQVGNEQDKVDECRAPLRIARQAM